MPLHEELRHWVRGRQKLVRKRAVLEHNRELFAGLDLLVVPEAHSTRLKTDLGLGHLPMIHIAHGPKHHPTRSQERLDLFELVLVPGPAACARLVPGGFVEPERCRVIGYPKFDPVDLLAPERPRAIREHLERRSVAA